MDIEHRSTSKGSYWLGYTLETVPVAREYNMCEASAHPFMCDS
jgi:hypothetical protein